MRRTMWITLAALACLLGTAVHAQAEDTGLTAAQVLDRMDESINGPKDQSYTLRLVLTDKDGGQKTREMIMLQKGREKRMVRFLSPADQRGIAFLSLPGGIQYLYLPAFNKVRRIASQVKNTNFAGTDFTYDDLEAVKWSDKWTATILSRDPEKTVLQMTPVAGRTADYPRQLVTVRSDNFYPVRIEMYDTSGALAKILLRGDLKQVQGYWVSMETTMEDCKKHHKTQMLVSDLKLDSGIGEEKFTERALGQ
jgi:outer membrane lipoprotein-sorting protein